MNYKEFTGQVQHRLEYAHFGQAVQATRAVLTTLGERLYEGKAMDLASPLLMEIDWYLTEAEHGQRFDYQEFLDCVANRTNVDRSDANYHAQQRAPIVAEIVPADNIEKADGQLPDDYDRLFELIDKTET
ncbi:DUF2267 domain-containing protein [Halostagnicola bangensis]